LCAWFESKALAASATQARGRIRLAEGDGAGAGLEFTAAAQLWNEVGAPYETALARMGLGDAYRAEGRKAPARLEYRAAASAFKEIGAGFMAGHAAQGDGDAPPAPSKADARGHGNVFRREGDVWSLVFENQTARLRDLKGLHYLARLLADPGKEFHVVDLVSGERPETPLFPGGSNAGEMLDTQAKQAYRRRLAEIEEDLEEARTMGNTERAAQAEAEHEFLVRELARAVGLGGRDRLAGSVSERARASVTRAVRQAMRRIREHNAPLGEHLDRAIRTGTYCAYMPDSRVPVRWEL
jgi:hypothetical protein